MGHPITISSDGELICHQAENVAAGVTATYHSTHSR